MDAFVLCLLFVLFVFVCFVVVCCLFVVVCVCLFVCLLLFVAPDNNKSLRICKQGRENGWEIFWVLYRWHRSHRTVVMNVQTCKICLFLS